MVDKALLVRGDHYGIPQALFFSLGDATNLPQWKQFCCYLMRIQTYQHTVVFVFVFLKKRPLPTFSQRWTISSGVGTRGRQKHRQWSSKALGISAPRTTSFFSRFPSFLPTSLFWGKWRPLFFPSANTSWAFQAWRSSWWAANNQSSIHRAGCGSGNVKYRAR